MRGRIASQLGDVAYGRRDYAGAEADYRAAVGFLERAYPKNHPLTAAARNGLANVLFDTGRDSEAEELWRRTRAAFEAVLGPDHIDTAAVMGNLALVHDRRARGSVGEASREGERDDRDEDQKPHDG